MAVVPPSASPPRQPANALAALATPAALDAPPPCIRVLGCSGALARHRHTTAFLLDDDVLIDAGSGVGELPLEDLARINHILLSHSHLDHVLAVPLLADSVIRLRQGRPPIQVHALPETLKVLRQHVFNNQLWPDFTRLPSADAPMLSLQPLQCGQTLRVGTHNRLIQVLPAAHSVPAVGFAVVGPQGLWVYTGDTGPNPSLWQHLAGQSVAHLVIELAFPQAEDALAQLAGHHTPSSLAAELAEAGAAVTVGQLWLTHLKPGDEATIQAELRQHPALAHARVLQRDQIFAWPAGKQLGRRLD